MKNALVNLFISLSWKGVFCLTVWCGCTGCRVSFLRQCWIADDMIFLCLVHVHGKAWNGDCTVLGYSHFLFSCNSWTFETQVQLVLLSHKQAFIIFFFVTCNGYGSLHCHLSIHLFVCLSICLSLHHILVFTCLSRWYRCS